jgi:hypothetical protein
VDLIASSHSAAPSEDALLHDVPWWGAEGLLLTDWGDNGHLQPPIASLPGILAAAGLP